MDPAFDKMGCRRSSPSWRRPRPRSPSAKARRRSRRRWFSSSPTSSAACKQIVPTKELTAAAGSARKGNLIKFSEPSNKHTVIDEDSVLMAEAAQELATKEKITYGEALTRVRAQGVKKEGDASAAAV
jgi:hypothetical protein